MCKVVFYINVLKCVVFVFMELYHLNFFSYWVAGLFSYSSDYRYIFKALKFNLFKVSLL